MLEWIGIDEILIIIAIILALVGLAIPNKKIYIFIIIFAVILIFVAVLLAFLGYA